MATINEVFYNHLKNSSTMQTEFTGGVHYVVNDDKAKEPYAVVWLSEDNQDIVNLCIVDQGEASFACEVYSKTYTKGVNKRKAFQDVCRELEATITYNINVWKVSIQAVSDRSVRIDGLFSFTFEAVLSWELDT